MRKDQIPQLLFVILDPEVQWQMNSRPLAAKAPSLEGVRGCVINNGPRAYKKAVTSRTM